MARVFVNSSNVKYSSEFIQTEYDYQFTTTNKQENGTIEVTPHIEQLSIRTGCKVPKVGVMLVGWGGNNGTTFTAALLTNRLGLTWSTRRGVQTANWYGSLTQSGTVRLSDTCHLPLAHIVPTISPDQLSIDGWDISSTSLADAMERAQVLEPSLVEQLRPHMISMRPRPSIYVPEFIAANQRERADNTLNGTSVEQVERICDDIRHFKRISGVECVIIVWTANTERFCDVIDGVHDTYGNLKAAIEENHAEISPSTLFAYASIKEGCTYINGSPQNTFVPGIIEMAERCGVFIGGDDFKSGQTKMKSVLVDFLVGAGIKPTSIVSYNHLGNNDGRNLSSPQQFRSKEMSKSNVVDDVVSSNPILYAPGEKPDHVVVIKYVPYVGDSKRALDEYTSEILMGGHNTIVVHNTCEDSLLAAPIIIDLVVLAELCSRIQIKLRSQPDSEYTGLHTCLSILSYLCKAPLVPAGTPIVNALFRQRACIENILKACIGLPPDNNMMLEHKVVPLMMQFSSTSSSGLIANERQGRKVGVVPPPPIKRQKIITNGIGH